ncbi:class F sortase [Pseudonocardia bannensis]|uniref:class F sortase n=1 Tax=Pseudonocardia bannensis TaxID=630973 RepID=UPI0028B1ACD0|nr:class F sortase [Pseudonocardia bannensis]
MAVLLTVLAVTGAVAGCGTSSDPASTAPSPAPVTPSVPVTPIPSPTLAAAPERPLPALPKARPVAVSVRSIGMRTDRLIDLGLTRTGEMEVPEDAVTAGWFELGPTPGEVGPAVIAAHVDYAGVPGLFTRLHDVRPGDDISVTRADGRTATFTAYRVDRFAKSRFPTQQVYGNTESPELRLITCGGAFDRASGNYLDNVVVFARLTATGTA